MSTRDFTRYHVDLTVDASTKDAFLSSRVSNISRGGMFLESPTPLPIQSEVEVTLHLGGPSGPTISVRGRVAWTRDMRRGSIHMLTGLGIRFLDLGSEDRLRLEAFLALLAKEDRPQVSRLASRPAAP